MFLSKTNCFLRLKVCVGSIQNNHQYVGQGQRWLFVFNNSARNDKLCTRDMLRSYIKGDFLCWQICTRQLSTKSDDIEDLSSNESTELKIVNYEEKEEEKKKYRKGRSGLTENQYCKLIKAQLDKGQLGLALHVLDMMKESRVKPTLYVYKLLMSGCARRGELVKCNKLYQKLKRHNRSWASDPKVISNLINACSFCNNTDKALIYLNKLRVDFHNNSYPLNEIHYAILIKAYGRLNNLEKAYEIADEARDKGHLSANLFTHLFQAAISNKQDGLKYALKLWHLMKIHKIKPTIIHYEHLLRAIRDTEFGDLKPHESLVPKSQDTQILLSKLGKVDLLSSPPVLSKSLNQFIQKDSTKEVTESSCTSNDNDYEQYCLNDILRANRLVLFGGLENILSGMESHNVKPTIATVTLLLDLLPPSTDVEEQFVAYIRRLKIDCDITFFNTLIKKRCMRKNYEKAKDVVSHIQTCNLVPNLLTFGVLAIGCTSHKDGMELLEQMNNIGYEANSRILNTLLHNACSKTNFEFILKLMFYVLKHQIYPSTEFMEMLIKFDKILVEIINKKNNRSTHFVRRNYRTFKVLYDDWTVKIEKYNRNALHKLVT